MHEDGTWTIEYAAQVTVPGKRMTDQSNSQMMNNLSDGIPVALLVKERAGYRVRGLAYDDLTDAEREILERCDELDDGAYVSAQILRRKHQGLFRAAMIEAYDGSCAATGTGALSVLQAAHIDPFAASKSHAISNGLLLRADIHLLYDAHLLTVMPGSGKLVVSELVKDEEYRALSGKKNPLSRYQGFLSR